MPDSEEYLQHLSEEFDALTQLRNEVGEEEYGHATFLTVPLIRYAAEELADTANYCRFLYIKLRLMEATLNARGIDLSAGTTEEAWDDNEIPLGIATFISGEEIQGFLSKKEQ